MSKTPAIPFFGDAYLADTRHLSLEEHGAYLQLMMIAWRTPDCALPDDDARIARMLGVSAAKWAKLKPIVMDFWTLDDGRWTQKRLKKERDFVSEKRGKNAEAARSRWSRQATENTEGDECERTSERTSTRRSERTSERNAPPPTKDLDKSKSTRVRKNRKGKGRTFQPPEWVPGAPWAAFAEMRRKAKQPFTDRAAELIIADLERLKAEGFDVGAVLNQSVKRGWMGVFALKEGPSSVKVSAKPYEPQTEDELQRAIAAGETYGYDVERYRRQLAELRGEPPPEAVAGLVASAAQALAIDTPRSRTGAG